MTRDAAVFRDSLQSSHASSKAYRSEGQESEPMLNLDRSQRAFCSSTAPNIRLLAPAGCGKTTALLHRCLRLARESSGSPRFLLVTFTRSAAAEIMARMANDPQFAPVAGQVSVSTLNAYGYRRIREKVRSPKLLISPADHHFAMLNQLRTVWVDLPHIAEVVQARGSGARRLMDVMDNIKSMGFDHTVDTNRELFQKRLDILRAQGLGWRIAEQFEILTSLGLLEPTRHTRDAPSTSRRHFYDRFFTFWRKASTVLHKQATFTFEDQKYWAYLDLRSPGSDGKRKPFISGAARYDHILVDEFQDINPLDLSLIKVIGRTQPSQPHHCGRR